MQVSLETHFLKHYRLFILCLPFGDLVRGCHSGQPDGHSLSEITERDVLPAFTGNVDG